MAQGSRRVRVRSAKLARYTRALAKVASSVTAPVPPFPRSPVPPFQLMEKQPTRRPSRRSSCLVSTLWSIPSVMYRLQSFHPLRIPSYIIYLARSVSHQITTNPEPFSRESLFASALLPPNRLAPFHLVPSRYKDHARGQSSVSVHLRAPYCGYVARLCKNHFSPSAHFGGALRTNKCDHRWVVVLIVCCWRHPENGQFVNSSSCHVSFHIPSMQ